MKTVTFKQKKELYFQNNHKRLTDSAKMYLSKRFKDIDFTNLYINKKAFSDINKKKFDFHTIRVDYIVNNITHSYKLLFDNKHNVLDCGIIK